MPSPSPSSRASISALSACTLAPRMRVTSAVHLHHPPYFLTVRQEELYGERGSGRVETVTGEGVAWMVAHSDGMAARRDQVIWELSNDSGVFIRGNMCGDRAGCVGGRC